MHGNNAPLSARYLNSQLTTLWQNAVQCANEDQDSALDVSSRDFEKTKYTRALAQFQYFGPKAPATVRSAEDLFFYARFGQPDLKFVCNHEAILSFTVEKTNLNIDYGRSNVTGSHPDPQMNHHIQNVQAYYRVPLYRHDVKSEDSVLAARPFNYLVRLVLLDLESAKLIRFKSESSFSIEVERALKFYLWKYLGFLHQGGNDVLYDVPHTDDVRIDYVSLKGAVGKAEVAGKTQINGKAKFSGKTEIVGKMEIAGKTQIAGKTEVAGKTQIAGKTESFTGLTIHSVDVRSINEYLHWQWEKAVRASRAGDLSASLAEISSAWVPNCAIDNHFSIRFGAPEIRTPCPHEVVLLFHVEDITWYEDINVATTNKEAYHNWTIAFAVDAVEEKEGLVSYIKLKLSTARFASQYSDYTETDSTVARYFRLFVKFMSSSYLGILTRLSLNVVYSSEGIKESVSTIDLAYKPGIVATDGRIVAWTRQIEQLGFYGFDEITALSEEAVNLMYSSLWYEASRRQTDNVLADWTSDKFSASFGAPAVRLLSNGKAIVWLTVKRGEVELPKDAWTSSSRKYSFSDSSSFAFEVDLKLAEERVLSVNDLWRQKFHSSDVWLRFKDQQDWHFFKHLMLDFRNPKYVAELSTLASLGRGRDSLVRQGALLNVLRGYLSGLADSGYNVLYSVPVRTQRGQNISFAYTDVRHQVVTRGKITANSCGTSRTVYESPVILILGVCNFRPMPSARIIVPWHDNWIIHSKKYKTFGSVYLSKHAFLESRLLPLLESINQKTTVVPQFAGVIDDEWHFDIGSWAKDPYRSRQRCIWEKGTQNADGSIEYVWNHYGELSQREKAMVGNERNAESTLSCRTLNKVIIPIVVQSDVLDVELKGESHVRISGKSDIRKWSKQSTATWSNTIRVLSDTKGLVVELAGEIRPVFSSGTSEGQATIDIGGLHAKHLPSSIDMQDILSALKRVLEGQWGFSALGLQRCILANPTITTAGGLILQLCEDKHVEAIVSRGTSAVTVQQNGGASNISDVIATISHSMSGSSTSVLANESAKAIDSFIASMTKPTHVNAIANSETISTVASGKQAERSETSTSTVTRETRIADVLASIPASSENITVTNDDDSSIDNFILSLFGSPQPSTLQTSAADATQSSSSTSTSGHITTLADVIASISKNENENAQAGTSETNSLSEIERFIVALSAASRGAGSTSAAPIVSSRPIATATTTATTAAATGNGHTTSISDVIASISRETNGSATSSHTNRDAANVDRFIASLSNNKISSGASVQSVSMGATHTGNGRIATIADVIASIRSAARSVDESSSSESANGDTSSIENFIISMSKQRHSESASQIVPVRESVSSESANGHTTAMANIIASLPAKEVIRTVMNGHTGSIDDFIAQMTAPTGSIGTTRVHSTGENSASSRSSSIADMLTMISKQPLEETRSLQNKQINGDVNRIDSFIASMTKAANGSITEAETTTRVINGHIPTIDKVLASISAPKVIDTTGILDTSSIDAFIAAMPRPDVKVDVQTVQKQDRPSHVRTSSIADVISSIPRQAHGASLVSPIPSVYDVTTPSASSDYQNSGSYVANGWHAQNVQLDKNSGLYFWQPAATTHRW